MHLKGETPQEGRRDSLTQPDAWEADVQPLRWGSGHWESAAAPGPDPSQPPALIWGQTPLSPLIIVQGEGKRLQELVQDLEVRAVRGWCSLRQGKVAALRSVSSGSSLGLR